VKAGTFVKYVVFGKLDCPLTPEPFYWSLIPPFTVNLNWPPINPSAKLSLKTFITIYS
jgi:hypothetical protein